MGNNKMPYITETISGECFALRVRMLNRALTALYDDAFRTLGLTANQFSLLTAVSRMKKATAKRLSTAMLMDPSTVSRSLERMRKEGWVKGTIGDDARSQELSLTEKGSHVLEQAFPLWQKAQVRVRKLLGRAGAYALNELAEGLRSSTRSA